MQEGTPTVTLTRQGRSGIVRLEASRGNAIGPALLADLSAAFRKAQADPEVGGVLLAAAGKLFSPGLDLQGLTALDRTEMSAFMERFSATIQELYAFPKPVVAAISGHAVAGGCVLALTADWRVLKTGALIGLNEVQIGVPLPYGVALLLAESVARPALSAIALLGMNFKDEEARTAGLAHEIAPAEGFEAACLARLEEFLAKDPEAFARTKSYLRSEALEKMRAGDAARRREFLECWFRPSTQDRIAGIVRELRARRPSP
jgi:enoyl-CoA hydratase